MKNYRNCFKNTLTALIGIAMLFTSCNKDDKSGNSACEIMLFSVNGLTWNINGTDISYVYPMETVAASLTPTIVLSPGATVNPSPDAAQNFFAEQGVKYSVTAEDGKTTQSYIAKATIAKNTACDIVSFVADGVGWKIDGTNITYVYPLGTSARSLTPVITLSTGATVIPSPNDEQNFFTPQGVTYTVTAEDGVTTKTYTVKAMIMPSSDCDIISFSVNGTSWKIDETNITYDYSSEPNDRNLTPTIVLSPGATIDPPAEERQYFFILQGVTYTVTAEDGVTTKTYTVKATINALISDISGDCFWTLTGAVGNYTLTVGGNGAMENYDYDNNRLATWNQYSSDIKNVIIEDGVTNIGNWAFVYCSGLTSVVIPNSVTTIGGWSFSDCVSLTSVTIPNSVTSIGNNAFYYCSNLTSISIPNSVTSIGNAAFGYCSSLRDINVDAGNPSYSSENGVMFNKNKTRLTVCPGGKTGDYTIPNSVTYLDNEAFYGCIDLTSITIPNSVIGLGYSTFAGCINLTDIIIPNSITTIGSSVFAHCSSLTDITIPNSVTSIGEQAFSYCSGLTSIVIPNSITAIGNSAFYYCINLTSVTISSSATSIDESAFADCSSLNEIINLNPVPQNINANVFDYVNLSVCTLKVPANAVQAYQTAPIWSQMGNIEAIP
jgi:hypothetical protein